MAKGFFIQEGSNINFVNTTGADIQYQDVLVITDRIGVALSDIAIGELGALGIAGVYELPAAAADAFTVGQNVYWDATAGAVTATATGNTPCGFVAEPKATASGTSVLVKIG